MVQSKPIMWDQYAYQKLVMRTVTGLGDELAPLRYQLLPAARFANLPEYEFIVNRTKGPLTALEAATVAPVPVLKRGAMVRKGQTGVQKDDGMTAEIADSIKSWVEKLVPDPECRRWMYEGGALPAKSTGS